MGRVGREEAAREMLGRLVDAVNSGSGDPYGVALAYVALDEPVQALDWLAEALEFRSRDLVLLPSDPVWAPLRDRPAFAELVNAIGDR